MAYVSVCLFVLLPHRPLVVKIPLWIFKFFNSFCILYSNYSKLLNKYSTSLLELQCRFYISQLEISND